MWCWRRLFRVPWTARTSNQSILKEINTEYSLEGLMLKLKLQYFGHLMQRADSLEKTLMLGKIEGKRRRGRQRIRWLDGITNSMHMNLSKLWEIVEFRGAWWATVHGVAKNWTQLNGWTAKIILNFSILSVKVLWFAENDLRQLQRTLNHRGFAKICVCPWSKQEAGPEACNNRARFHSLPIYICSLKF